MVAQSIRLAFGLAFDVEKDPTRPSGFKPAEVDLGSHKQLFGDIRLEGFAAMLKEDCAQKIIILGGNEGRYKSEVPTINRADKIREMLIKDFGIEPSRVEAIASTSNTGGNIAIMAHVMAERSFEMNGCMVVTNHYHIPRASIDLMTAGLHCPSFAAEAFLMLANRECKQDLIRRLGSGPLAERSVEEIQGMADKFAGAYKPRTDTSPMV